MLPISEFKKIIWDYYHNHGRHFEWRNENDPYKIFISEVMLQQTQTLRVAKKYPEFIARFNSFDSLAQASLKEVLFYWQGLGYNRRGKYLHEAAKAIMHNYKGIIPPCPTKLSELPGIGKATAGSISAFAFNMPTVFIETNIRTVFIYFFFKNQEKISDKDILCLIKGSLDLEQPRHWYYALMDYGVMLKKKIVNPNRKSLHYKIQSKFKGSNREIRGRILKILTHASEPMHVEEVIKNSNSDALRTQNIINQLEKEKLIFVRKKLLWV